MRKLKGFAVSILAVSMLAACGAEEPEADVVESPPVEHKSVLDGDEFEEESGSEESPWVSGKTTNEVLAEKNDNFEETMEEAHAETKSLTEPTETSLEALNVSITDGRLFYHEVTDDGYFYDAEEGDVLTILELDVSVENTAEDLRRFYVGQSTIVTNTGVQVDGNIRFAGDPDSEIKPGGTVSGTIQFILVGSNLGDTEYVDVYFPGISDADMNRTSTDNALRVHFK